MKPDDQAHAPIHTPTNAIAREGHEPHVPHGLRHENMTAATMFRTIADQTHGTRPRPWSPKNM